METTYSHGGELFLVPKPLLVLSTVEAGGGANVSFLGGQIDTGSLKKFVVPNVHH